MDEQTMMWAFEDELEKIAEHRKEANIALRMLRGTGKAIGTGIDKGFGAVGKRLAGTGVGRAADKASVWGKGQVNQAIKLDQDAAKAAAKAAKRKAKLQAMTPEQRLKATSGGGSSGGSSSSGPGFLQRNWKPIAIGAAGLGGGAMLASRGSSNPE